MAQPVVQRPTLSPPLSPGAVHSSASELSSKAAILSNGESSPSSRHSHHHKSTAIHTNGLSSTRSKPRSRPHSSRSNANSNGRDAHDNGERTRIHGVEAANDPTIAEAPGASFSVATKPQDRDPSLLRQPPQSKSLDGLSSYHLDHNGRIPASDYNYIQRDKLVASAQQSAIRSGNLHWVALMDLAHLASQHHLSPYSMMKFGPRGSPFAYIPITLQQPEVVKNTMSRQRDEELEAKAWLITKRQQKLGLIAATSTVQDSDDDLPVLSLSSDIFKHVNAKPPINEAPSSIGTKRPASLTTPPDTRARCVFRTDKDEDEPQQIERDLSEAMADSFDPSRSPPREVLAPRSAEASSSSEEDVDVAPLKADQVDLSRFDRSTRMVEIGTTTDPNATNGDADLNEQSGDAEQKHDGQVDELMTSSQAGSSVEVGGPMDKSRTMAQEMEEASATTKPAYTDTSVKNDSLGPLRRVEGASTARTSNDVDPKRSSSEQQRQAQQNHLAMKTSDTHPIHISPILTDDLLADVGRRIHSDAELQLLKLDLSTGNEASTLPAADGRQLTALTERYFEEHAREQVEGNRLIRLRNVLDLTSITATDPSANYLSQSQLAEQASKENILAISSADDAKGKDGMGTNVDYSIGNLLLSSCPGKKVRLSGPVRGRGAICRDLGLDLTRIFSIGVRAVVCCLNDEELSYLGAPWEEYEREADRLGLDIYRLPMAEGFAPTKVEEMDATMTSIVMDCTMKGINVLVHCRGGVGRAGLIACAWLLKMGFVGEGSERGMNRVDEEVKVGEMIKLSKEIVERTTSVSCYVGLVNEGESEVQDGGEVEVECQVILDTVRSLIETIRRRRSPKAIETAEQVRFLVEYLTYLHKQERLKASFQHVH